MTRKTTGVESVDSIMNAIDSLPSSLPESEIHEVMGKLSASEAGEMSREIEAAAIFLLRLSSSAEASECGFDMTAHTKKRLRGVRKALGYSYP